MKIRSGREEYEVDSFETLKKWIWETRVVKGDLLYSEETQSWVRIDEIPELAVYFRPRMTVRAREPLRRPQKGSQKTELQMAPLIDCIFLLLIFFLLTSTFKQQAGLDIELPEAATAMEELKEDLTVYISKEGDLKLNDQDVTMNSLLDLLRQRVKENEQKTLIIEADKEASHGIVVGVMDISNLSGIHRFLIASEIKESEGPKNEIKR